MKILFIGYGSIAIKHKISLEKKFKKVNFYALRHKIDYKNIDGVNSILKENLLNEKFNAIIISSPSVFHCDQIFELINLNTPILVEKPLCVNRTQWNKLYKLSRKKHPIIYVACNMRFNPMITYLKKYLEVNKSRIYEVSAYAGSYLPEWRPNLDYRKSYSSIKKLGGGVEFDLVHETDMLYFLFGEPISSKIEKRKISNLNIDSNDWALIYLKYVDFSATINLNYYRKRAKRTIEIVREKDIIQLDFIKGTIVDLKNNKILFDAPKGSMKLSYDFQFDYFFDCIKNNKVPLNNLKEALKVCDLILNPNFN